MAALLDMAQWRQMASQLLVNTGDAYGLWHYLNVCLINEVLTATFKIPDIEINLTIAPVTQT